eukprot:15482725-Alexandrium_andersonii.AAC.1
MAGSATIAASATGSRARTAAAAGAPSRRQTQLVVRCGTCGPGSADLGSESTTMNGRQLMPPS